MIGFAIFLVSVGVFHSVTGENSLQPDNQGAKHSPVLFLTLKLIDDVYELKEEVVELKTEKSDLNKQISELQVSIEDLKSENSDLKLEVSGLSAKQISELQVSIDDLKSENSDLKLEVSSLSAVISEQEDAIEMLESKFINYEIQGQDRKESGATYVRWGRTECPSGIGTVKIYDAMGSFQRTQERVRNSRDKPAISV